MYQKVSKLYNLFNRRGHPIVRVRSFYAAILFYIVTLIVIDRAKQLNPANSVKSFLIFCIATLIVGNIVYISCNLSSFMLLVLFHDPLVTLSTYFIFFMVIIFTFCFCFLMATMMPLWKVNHAFMLHDQVFISDHNIHMHFAAVLYNDNYFCSASSF